MGIVVVWYRSPSAGVGWWPTLPLPDDAPETVERERADLRRRFKNKGGVETMVKRYAELDDVPTPDQYDNGEGRDGLR